MSKPKKVKKHRGKSTQDLIGIKGFSNYGLATNRGELVFYLISPTNISVLSSAAIEIKTRHLLMILQSEPEIEIACLDSCQCFDENKIYLKQRLSDEQNPDVSAVLKQDLEHLDSIQVTMSTARQFVFIARMKSEKEEQVFDRANRIEKIIAEQNFEVERLQKSGVKRLLAIYFGASMNGELMGDYDGENHLRNLKIRSQKIIGARKKLA